MPIEPYDGYYRRSELEAMKAEAARVERERCNAEIERLRALALEAATLLEDVGNGFNGREIRRRVLNGDR